MIEWRDFKTAASGIIGQTLIDWARYGTSYPPEDFTFEEWTAMLYMHGCALARYGFGRYRSEYEDDDGCAVSFGVNLGIFAWIDEEDCAQAEAKLAMFWLAENFENLWD